MNLRNSDPTESRFAAYVEGLIGVIGHSDRIGPLRDHCVGLILRCERKSVKLIAARTAPARTSAQHQNLLHFIGVAAWSDEKVLAKVREMVLPAIERHGAIEAWIIDDASFPKKGRHSVGVGGNIADNWASRTDIWTRRETVPHDGHRLKFLEGRTVITVFSTSQNALTTTNPDGTKLERCSGCCMVLIPSTTAPRESETSSKLSQSQICTPNNN